MPIEQTDKKGVRAQHNSNAPCIIDAPGHGYPSRSCVPAELRSVSPRIIHYKKSLNTRYASKNPNVNNSKMFPQELSLLLTKLKTVAVHGFVRRRRCSVSLRIVHDGVYLPSAVPSGPLRLTALFK